MLCAFLNRADILGKKTINCELHKINAALLECLTFKNPLQFSSAAQLALQR